MNALKKKWHLIIISVLTIVLLSGCGPKFMSITASYDGSTEAGVVLDNNNEGIHVAGDTEQEKNIEIESGKWKIKEPITLEPGGCSSVEISKGDLSCQLNVWCTTCGTCQGEGKVACTDCDQGKKSCDKCDSNGEVKCKACSGNGKITCEDCDGQGHLICSKCDGEGRIYTGMGKCYYCGGNGTITQWCSNCGGIGITYQGTKPVKCARCGGRGQTSDTTCFMCKGKGQSAKYDDCEACQNTGYSLENCPKCNGEKQIDCESCKASGRITCDVCNGEKKYTCPRCSGTLEMDCPGCNGTGINSHPDAVPAKG